MLNDLYSYDLLEGFYYVLLMISSVFVFTGFLFIHKLLSPLSLMDKYISSIKDQKTAKYINLDSVYNQIYTIPRKLILFLFGHNGNNREKTPEENVTQEWVNENSTLIFRRFLPIYMVYISSLVILCRPVSFEGLENTFYGYEKNQTTLFTYLIIYVFSNSFFDFFSLRYSLNNLNQIIAIKNKSQSLSKIFLITMKDLLFAGFCFIFSQVISCFLWYFKRDTYEAVNLSTSGEIINTAYLFIDITLWPYAFIGANDANSILNVYFPGQLLITGTVFIPTIFVLLMALSLAFFLQLSYQIKIRLSYLKINKTTLEDLCSKPVFIPFYSKVKQKGDKNISYCNALLIGALYSLSSVVLSSIISAVIGVNILSFMP